MLRNLFSNANNITCYGLELEYLFILFFHINPGIDFFYIFPHLTLTKKKRLNRKIGKEREKSSILFYVQVSIYSNASNITPNQFLSILYKRKTWKSKMIKNMLKSRKESNTYLTIVCRHRWSRQIMMKVDKLLELSASTVVFISWRGSHRPR